MSYQTRELWKVLMKEGRILPFPAVLGPSPQSDSDWCAEAVELQRRMPGLGILTTKATKRIYQKLREVASVENRPSSEWWSHLESGHPDGPTTGRKVADYQGRLLPLLKSARSLKFVDPHLDPARPGYSTFLSLIDPALSRSSLPPRIQIHRCCSSGSGENRSVDPGILEHSFRARWDSTLKAKGRKIEVFIWSDFHDRYLITDLLGVHLGNGFDTTDDVNKRVTWSRLSASHRDQIQRQVDPGVESAKLKHRFTIG